MGGSRRFHAHEAQRAACPRALHAAQLLDGSSLGSHFAKAHRIHFSHDFSAARARRGRGRLKEQPVGSCAAGPPRGAEGGHSLRRSMRPAFPRGSPRRRRAANASAGLQHKAGDVDDWNAHPAVIHDDQASSSMSSSSVLHEQARRMLLGRCGGDAVARAALRATGAHPVLRISISPQPKHFAFPNPLARASTKSEGDATVNRPSMSNTPSVTSGAPRRGTRDLR